jgi:tRNA-dihydrouridine synthase B
MIRLHSSPLQGYTDFRFRNAYHRYFRGIDQYMAPYIRIKGSLEIKPAHERDILPANNPSMDLIPQVMAKDPEAFLFVAAYLQNLGYDAVNWNLGCPYPMVANKGMGSGMLAWPDKIDAFLHRVMAETDMQLSVKMRLGYEHASEILEVLPVLEKYPLSYIAIHPRIGKQLYKGTVDLDAFEACLPQISHTLFYNGDINSVQRFRELRDRFPGIRHWMIGRSLLADPFLPAMIKADEPEYPENRYEMLRAFHDTLFASYEEALSGSRHLLTKMYAFWEYLIASFPASPKGLKKIRKAQSLNSYQEVVNQLFETEASQGLSSGT